MTTLNVRRGPEFTRILGLGVARGEHLVPNDDLIEPINSSDEWIRKMTGIVTRVRADKDTSVIDLSERAARDAIAQAGIDASEVDAVILSTITYPHITPGGAPVLAERLGATPAAAYDISAACAGYSYGIGQADALVRSGAARNVLVVGAEKMSDFVDPADRSISYLLGDAAGAVVIGGSDTAGIGPTVWGSDGGGAELIRQTDSWIDVRDNGAPFPTLRQEGPSVFKWASFKMAPVALEAIEVAGLTPDDIDVFIPHQANVRIIDQMVKQIGLPERVVVAKDIVDSGNTSAASIPLATERVLRDGDAKSGDVALQIGFGAGLVYAAQVVILP
ncbi:beta-ketoacyl-ACP synthase III [Demequina silvatica]|uniref:beta-ketoacyl-ACP synthase III n=1 Tax=Demequina silvatica TaxID=1638988 RepID=UPI00078214E9|nr:beta-ketoacyl-ACP synthase III [Demequina silvatica]